MFKGFIALITSGIIFNPAVLIGALIGVVAYIKLDFEEIKILCTDYHLYLFFLFVCCLYVYFFKKTLKDNLRDLDLRVMFSTMIGQFFLMCFSFLMGMLLASFFDFSIPEPSAKKTHSEYSETVGSINRAKNLQNDYNHILDQIK